MLDKLKIAVVNIQLKTFFVFCLTVSSIYSGYSQSIEILKIELRALSEKPGYANDTIYLNKANELGFVLAESFPDSAFKFLDKQILLCREAKYKKGESVALKIFGNALQNKGDFKASLAYYEDAIKLAKELEDEKLVPGILNNIGLVYYNLGNYAGALGIFYEAIKGAENTGNLNVKAAGLNNLAMIYFEQGKLEDAKSKYREMLQIYTDMGAQGRMILAYNNIGDVELKQNRPVAALENLKKGNELALALQSSEFIEMTSRTLADIYAALDSGEKAEALYRQSIAISTEKGYGVPYSHSLIGLAGLLLKRGDISDADKFAREGLKQAEKMGQPMQLRNAHELLASILEKEGNYPEALESFKLFKSFNDSINNLNAQRLAATLESEFEFSKKTLEFEKESLIQRWIIFSTMVGLGIFLVVLFIVYRNRNMLTKAYSNLKEKTIEIENKNERLEKTLLQLKSAQLQLIQSEKMASLGELTAGIAHEIQNPLNFVNNFSEVSAELIGEIEEERVKKQEGRDETLVSEILRDVKENLRKINHHGNRADAIVKGMLAHSRTNTGEKAPTDINGLADEFLRLSYHGIRAKDKSFNADFVTDFDPDLPKINVIPQDIGRVLLNIINNAFQACGNSEFRIQNSEFKPKVEVSTQIKGDKIEISISDNGPGIPDAIKDKIFQPFFTTKPTGQGTGLGLSLSYDIVKAHGGEITVESKEGEGSTFIILLPIA